VLKLEQVPSPWFDEGWVLPLARNWVELGHYGYLLMGEPVPATSLSIGLPAVAPIALSFRLFGIGVWQGRLPGIFFTLGALGVLYYLARRLYDPSVAVGALAVALLLSWDPVLHPVLLGRQALGEMPAMFYLLAGYAAVSWAWRRPLWPVPIAIVFWALALRTKPQVLPFFVASLSLPLAIALWKRRWRTARILAFGFLGALVAVNVFARGQELLLSSPFFSPSSGNDLYSMARAASNVRTYWFVLVPTVRLFAMLKVVLVGLPVVLGLCFTAWRFVGNLHRMDLEADREVGRLVLWGFSASWLCWYLLLSVGWSRYLFPVVFVGSVFVAVLLRDVVGGFNMAWLLKRGVGALRQRRFTLPAIGTLLAAITIPAMCLLTLLMLYQSYVVGSDDSVLQAARFLKTHTAPDAVVETCEFELLFLLEHPYHYPPDSVLHQLNRRFFLGRNDVIDYNPLAANPDYLVVGNHGRMWRLYEPVIETGAFRLLQTYGHYEIYERAHPDSRSTESVGVDRSVEHLSDAYRPLLMRQPGDLVCPFHANLYSYHSGRLCLNLAFHVRNERTFSRRILADEFKGTTISCCLS